MVSIKCDAFSRNAAASCSHGASLWFLSSAMPLAATRRQVVATARAYGFDKCDAFIRNAAASCSQWRKPMVLTIAMPLAATRRQVGATGVSRWF